MYLRSKAAEDINNCSIQADNCLKYNQIKHFQYTLRKQVLGVV